MKKYTPKKMIIFPKKILEELDGYILKGYGPAVLKKILEERYKGPLKVPSTPTINVYIRERKKILKQFSENTFDLTSDLEKIGSSEIDLQDKRGLLENILKKCFDRVKKIEQRQSLKYSPASEAQVVRYITEVRSIIETLLKLSGELEENTQQIVVNIVNENLNDIMKVIYRVLMKVCPEKKEKFKEELQIELKKGGLLKK